MTKITTYDWTGCYPSKWKGIIVDDAMRHPAKFSSRLIRHIYEHMIAEGWLKPGDVVIDPFGGVALGALDAMRTGIRWRGVELEPRFAEVGNKNIALWNSRYSTMPKWEPDAVLLQGDSRFLVDVLNGEDHTAVISSPPYADGCAHTGGDDKHPEQVEGGEIRLPGIAGAISSPPYADSMESKGGIDPTKSKHRYGKTSQTANSDTRYGSTPGQLGAMKGNGFDAAISSPPFLDARSDTEKSKSSNHGGEADGAYTRQIQDYGSTPGQLTNMKEGDFDTTVPSPPYSERHSYNDERTVSAVEKLKEQPGSKIGGSRIHDNVGNSPGQLGQEGETDFWSAARTIVEQVYQVLAPGAHAVWVVKSFVRNKEIVDFPGQWRKLCEVVGFVTLHEHHALLVRHTGTSMTLEGGTVEHKTESKSFFRRLAEKNGSPRIDFEVILCMEKPA